MTLPDTTTFPLDFAAHWGIDPRMDGTLPLCSSSSCRRFDGKRCEELGAKPDRICEPAARVIGEDLRRLYVVAAAKGIQRKET